MRVDKSPEMNAMILKERVNEFNRVDGPRVGDFVRLPDGNFVRISTRHRDSSDLQVSNVGSFHLWGSSCEFSGPHIPKIIEPHKLRMLSGTKLGAVWIFNEGRPEADNGVDFEIEFRIFEIGEDYWDEDMKSVFKAYL